ncbi:MAG: thioredoxin domain-containing protein, partial [Propionibacteriaceae bacterium]|nr:thioredoxin domain-containing protein [Propionibacteriaceae bacterium]
MAETVSGVAVESFTLPWYTRPLWRVCAAIIAGGVLLIGYYTLERIRGNSLPDAVSQLQPPHQVLSDNGPTGITVPPTSALEPNAAQVVVYQDYQDAISAQVELVLSDALNALASRGEITLEYRTMTFLDRGKVDGPSQRAAVAAACADIQGVYAAYHNQVFLGQRNLGFTADQLRNEFAIAAGLEGADLSAFQTCYDNRRSEDFVKAVATNALADAVSATP